MRSSKKEKALRLLASSQAQPEGDAVSNEGEGGPGMNYYEIDIPIDLIKYNTVRCSI
jgi:hypothetical protein